MLVLDAFRGHLTAEVKQIAAQSKTFLEAIPGGLTSQLQPLDVSLNKPIKGLIREEWKICQWVLTAWRGVSEGIVVKSFQKCGISNNLDGTDDEAIYDDSDGGDDVDENVFENTSVTNAQDQDGSHIKGLLINYINIHTNWPELLRLPFLEEFITPIVKATKKNGEELSFFSLPEFEEWKAETNNSHTLSVLVLILWKNTILNVLTCDR
uniref:DNA topoisomerase (ATP-hydrolyzing) n=1 Tax=Anopheles funestus TaxID=62324 RepID=A0A182RD00_ANOFN